MKYIKSRALVPKIILAVIIIVFGMKIINPLLKQTYEKNIWSLKYLSRVIDVPKYDEDLYPPSEGHSNASLWLARDAIKSNNISLTYTLIEPYIYLENPFALSILGDALILEHKIYEALKIWADIGDVSSLLEFAKTAEEREDWEEAIDAYKNALTIDPNNSLIYFTIGHIMAKQNIYPEADLWFQQAIELNPRREWRLERARVAQEAGNLTLRQAVYKQLISQHPESAKYYFKIAWLYYLDQKFPQAESSIESALQFMPFPRANYYLRAGRIYEKAGKIQKAIESYEKVLTIEPENNVALKRLMILNSAN